VSDIKTITAPSVYLVGTQTVDDAALNSFLSDHGVSWESDSEVAGEVLTETAGRVCYMSFAKPRPGGNAAYLQHIKEVGHGCYDAETEVLTADGWKAWPDVTMADQFATIDPATRAITYQSPTRLVRFAHRGMMYRVESQGVDLLVTPTHKMLACPTTTRDGRRKGSYALIPAMELGTTSHAYLKFGEWAGGWWSKCPGRDVFALLGFAIGDGTMHGPNSGTVKFHLRRERKIAWLKAVVGRLAGLGFHMYVNEANDNYAVLLPDDEMVRSLFGGMYDGDGEKRIPTTPNVLLGASRPGLEGLYEGLMQSDGHEGQTGDSFDTTSPHLPGQFQQLCLHLGFAANVCYTYDREQRPTSYGDKPLTRLSVIRRSLRPEVNKWSGADGRSFWVDDWEGEVFCAEVPNHTLYVRRNGIPVWSGNSVLEHAVFNLIITGVSRSLTHELVRHRAGVSPSQLSQRYVDESVAEYVVPFDLQREVRAAEMFTAWTDGYMNTSGDGLTEAAQAFHEFYLNISREEVAAGQLWLDTIRFAHVGYTKLSAYLFDKIGTQKYGSLGKDLVASAEGKTEVRKAARQAARSVLPNATETKIFVTANARALRHFFEQRGSRHAEPEIRKLATAILDVLSPLAPNLFGDYTRTALPDGTCELVTPYRKV
jgi:thymidylate synthase (FAD)